MSKFACPACGRGDNMVKDSRSNVAADLVRRRRICTGCGERFTTFEVEMSAYVAAAALAKEALGLRQIVTDLSKRWDAIMLPRVKKKEDHSGLDP